MGDKAVVLYVAGTGRSGSTLLGNVLGSADGATSVGEVRHVWRRGMVEGWKCGCGAPFGACDFWSEVTTLAFAAGRVDLEAIQASERQLLRLRTSPLWLRWIVRPDLLGSTHRLYLDAVGAIYRAISEVGRGAVIVDTSKNPSYGALLSITPGIDLRVVHLLRDPRATAYSWVNPKPSPDRGENAMMDRLGVAKSALLWAWWNVLTEGLWRRRRDIPLARLTYESFVADPEGATRAVWTELLPDRRYESNGIEGDVARIAVAHSVSGNPIRMTTGPLVIDVDDRWRDGLDRRSATAVRVFAGPAMRHFGYGRHGG